MSTHHPANSISRLFLAVMIVVLIAPARTAAQVVSGDWEALQTIRSMIRTAEPAEIIAKCDEFVAKYSESMYINSILRWIAEFDPTSPHLLEYSRLAIANARGTPMAYNDVAWTLYRAKVHLDTAAVWAEHALTVLPPNSRNARERKNRAMLLDTLAHIVLETGDTDRAIRLMQEAVDQHDESYSYKLTLSEFLFGAGRQDEAEVYLVDALFLSPIPSWTVRATFNEYAADQVESEEEIPTWKTGAVRRGIERHLEAGRGEPGLRARLANILTDLEMLPDIALPLAEQAVAEDPEDPTALAALGAQLLKERRYDEAEKYLVEARLLSPQNHRARHEFDVLSQIKVLNGQDWFEYRASVFSAGIDRLLERVEDALKFKKKLAQTLELLGVVPDRAMQLAREWAENTGPEKGLEEFMTSHVLCAQLALNLGNAEEALSALEPVLYLAGPADSELHRVWAEALRALGRPEEAIEVFARVASIYQAQIYMEPMQELWEETYGNERDLEAYLEERSTGAESWHPTGEYEIPDEWAGRMALAELFTGVNCTPCISADIAYDHLREYYPVEVLGILIYHLNEPVTNPDAKARKEYYNAEEPLILGTPTSIINGTELKLGGGPRSNIRSLFLKYSLQVEKDLLEAVAVEIALSGERSGNRLTVQSTVSITDPEIRGNANLRMRIALAEKNVRYTGGNKLPEHHWVVRSMIGGPDGLPLETSQISTSYTTDVDLAEVEADLQTYLEEWVAENFVGRKLEEVFDTSCLDIDETQLVLVAFVQDDSTHVILQAAVLEVR